MAKKNQPADNAGKKKQEREPQARQERREKGKEKNKKKGGATKITAPAKETPGLTLAQLEAMNPPRKPAGRLAENVVLEDFLEALPVCLDQRLGINRATSSFVTCGEEESSTEDDLIEDGIEDTISQTALRNVLANEIRCLIETTQAIFDGLRISPEMAITALEVAFLGQPQNLRFAEILVADNQVAEIERLIDEVGGKIAELQLIKGAQSPDYELARAINLEIIEPAITERLKKSVEEEARRIGLQLRFQEIAAGKGEINETLAGIIGEAAQAVETQRQQRSQFRQRVAHGLRQRKERERQQHSNLPNESGDEEFIRFLLDHRGDLAAVRNNLPFHLREQVQSLLADENRKGPILRKMANLKAIAQRRWTILQSRLLAGADRPEEVVEQNRHSIRAVRNTLAEIRDLRVHLLEMDKQQQLEIPTADYSSTSRYRTWAKVGPQPTHALWS